MLLAIQGRIQLVFKRWEVLQDYEHLVYAYNAWTSPQTSQFGSQAEQWIQLNDDYSFVVDMSSSASHHSG